MNLSSDLRSLVSIGVIIVASVAGLQVMLNEPLRTEAAIVGHAARATHTELYGQSPDHGVMRTELDQRRARAERIITRALHLGAAGLDTLTIHERQSALGRKHGLEIRRMEPLTQNMSRDQRLDPWQSYRIEATGPYSKIARFIIDLENKDQLCRIDRLRVTPEYTGEQDHAFVSVVVSYYQRGGSLPLTPGEATAEVRE